MARSIDTIYQSIISEKINQPTLNTKLLNEDGSTTLNTEQQLLTSLSTTSKVSIWKLVFYTISVCIFTLESLWDLFKTEIEAIKSTSEPGTLRWWVDKIKKFQYEDVLIIDPDTFATGYALIDVNKQIIKNCAAVENDRLLTIKIRGKSSDILTVPQFDALQSYINATKFAGTKILTYNLLPDDLILNYTVYYDPIVNIDTVKSNVETAINDYISNVEFNSELNLTILTDRIQAVNGVKGVNKISAYGRSLSAPFVLFDNYYNSVAGYNIIDPSTPLSSSITYIEKY